MLIATCRSETKVRDRRVLFMCGPDRAQREYLPVSVPRASASCLILSITSPAGAPVVTSSAWLLRSRGRLLHISGGLTPPRLPSQVYFLGSAAPSLNAGLWSCIVFGGSGGGLELPPPQPASARAAMVETIARTRIVGI